MKFYQRAVRHYGKLVSQPTYRKELREARRLEALPRYRATETTLFECPIALTDAPSFLAMKREIIDEGIYRFTSASARPLIIDGGANVGVSVLYFKRLYPDSQIIAFEPDADTYQILSKNIAASGATGVQLVNKALWSEDTDLEFMVEGADGGRVVKIEDGQRNTVVPATSLRHYLKAPVDLLKLDIEGAETEVLLSCQDLLGNVQNLFVEYHSFLSEEQSLPKLLEAIKHAGFRFHIHPCNVSRQPFFQRNNFSGMDMQLNVFCYRA